jgi:FkbM family methyltransferase
MLTRAIKGLLVLFMVAVLTFVVGFFVYRPISAAEMVVVGRGPDCPTVEAIQSYKRFFSSEALQAKHTKTALIDKVDGAYQHIQTAWGPFWEPKIEGSAVVAQLAETDAKYADFAPPPIHAGDIVLDCGANVGTFTHYALRLGAKKVVAIEPAPNNLESLRRNFAKEVAEGRVIIYAKGVWDKDDFLTLHESNSTSAMDSVVITKDTRTGVRVPLTTIDKIVPELGLERVDFIKMDIEGAEKPALTGARETLLKWKPRLEISVNHLSEDPVKVPQLILQLQPQYKKRCLLCEADWNRWRILENILFFD